MTNRLYIKARTSGLDVDRIVILLLYKAANNLALDLL